MIDRCNNDTKIYIDTSASRLKHLVVEGSLDAGQFSVLQVGEISSQLLKFNMISRIIGASHWLTFEIGNKQFHEIFACTDYMLSGQELATYGSLCSVSANVELALWNKINYSFQSKIFPFSKAEDWLTELESQAQYITNKNGSQSIGLAYHFPKHEDLASIPKTIIVAQFSETKSLLDITTAHSYPNEQQIVRSKSQLTFL